MVMEGDQLDTGIEEDASAFVAFNSSPPGVQLPSSKKLK